jgi:hypothetical protein
VENRGELSKAVKLVEKTFDDVLSPYSKRSVDVERFRIIQKSLVGFLTKIGYTDAKTVEAILKAQWVRCIRRFDIHIDDREGKKSLLEVPRGQKIN